MVNVSSLVEIEAKLYLLYDFVLCNVHTLHTKPNNKSKKQNHIKCRNRLNSWIVDTHILTFFCSNNNNRNNRRNMKHYRMRNRPTKRIKRTTKASVNSTQTVRTCRLPASFIQCNFFSSLSFLQFTILLRLVGSNETWTGLMIVRHLISKNQCNLNFEISENDHRLMRES